jgi:large subunit ribosomal protein L4
MKKLAMRSALSSKLADGELIVVDELSFEQPSTKKAAAIVKALGLEGKRVTLVVDDEAVIEYLSFRNIPKVEVIAVSEANTRNLIDNAALVMTVDVAKQLEEALA